MTAAKSKSTTNAANMFTAKYTSLIENQETIL